MTAVDNTVLQNRNLLRELTWYHQGKVNMSGDECNLERILSQYITHSRVHFKYLTNSVFQLYFNEGEKRGREFWFI